MEINYNASLLLILSILLFGCVQEQAGAENANLSPTQPENVAGFATLESGDESGGTGTGEYTQPAPSGTGTGTGTGSGSGSESGSESGSGSGSGFGYGDDGSGSGSGYDYGSGSGSSSGDEEGSGSGTGTGSGQDSELAAENLALSQSLKCTLDSASEDRVGTWNNFTPGIGGGNPTPYDWKWICSIEFTKTKTITSITLKHELSTESWSTSNTQLYPIVVFKGDTQLNRAYGQTLGTYNAGKYDNFKLFGQIESETFSGAIATFTFSDGTTASTKIPPSDKKPQAPCIDSDNGADYFTQGTTTKGATTKTDYCINTETLNEYTCKDNQVKDATYKCPNGCDKDTGACKPDTTTPAINFCSYISPDTAQPFHEGEIYYGVTGGYEFNSGIALDLKIKKVENADNPDKAKATFELYEQQSGNLLGTATAGYCDDLRNLFISKSGKPMLFGHFFIKAFGKDDKGKVVSLTALGSDVCIESQYGGYPSSSTVIGTTGMLYGPIYKNSNPNLAEVSVTASFNNGPFIDSKEFPTSSPRAPTLNYDYISIPATLQGETTATMKIKAMENGQEVNVTLYCIGDAQNDEAGIVKVTVLDSDTKEAIPGALAKLMLDNTLLHYNSTGDDGVVFLASKAKTPPVRYLILVNAVGYESQSNGSAYIYSGGKTEVTFYLMKSQTTARDQLPEPVLNKNPENRVSIKAFFEFEGPFTKMFYNNQMKQILDTYPNEVSFSFTNYPLSIIHRYGTITALAGECAAAQGKFFEFADQLYGNDYSTFTRDVLLNIAIDAKLDYQAFGECLEEQTYYPEVLDDIKQGNAIDLTGTPTFSLSNGKREIRIVGAQSYDEFKKAIEFLLNDTEPPVDDAVIKSDFIVKEIVIKDASNGYVDIIRNPFTGDTGTYYVKNKIGGIKGTGKYDGQSMTIVILQLLSTNPAFGTPLQATFELQDKEGNVVDWKTASIGDNLRYIFKYNDPAVSGRQYIDEGEGIYSLMGSGIYKGQKLSIKFATLEVKRAAAGSQYPFIYTGTFELYNESGKLLDTQTAGKSDDLGSLFKDPNGQDALATSVNIDLIGLSWPNYTGYIEVTVKEKEPPTETPQTITLVDSKGYPYDPINYEGIYDYVVNLTSDSNGMKKIKIANSREKWNNSVSSNGPLYPTNSGQSLTGVNKLEYLNEGFSITNLDGKNLYEGKKLTVKLAQVTQGGGTTGTGYQGIFELYDLDNLIDTQTVTSRLGYNFAYAFRDQNDKEALGTDIFVNFIGVNNANGVPYASFFRGKLPEAKPAVFGSAMPSGTAGKGFATAEFLGFTGKEKMTTVTIGNAVTGLDSAAKGGLSFRGADDAEHNIPFALELDDAETGSTFLFDGKTIWYRMNYGASSATGAKRDFKFTVKNGDYVNNRIWNFTAPNILKIGGVGNSIGIPISAGKILTVDGVTYFFNSVSIEQNLASSSATVLVDGEINFRKENSTGTPIYNTFGDAADETYGKFYFTDGAVFDNQTPQSSIVIGGVTQHTNNGIILPDKELGGFSFSAMASQEINRLWLLLDAPQFLDGKAQTVGTIQSGKTLYFQGTDVPNFQGTENGYANTEYYVPQDTDFNFSDTRYSNKSAYFVANFFINGDTDNRIYVYIDTRDSGVIGPFTNSDLASYTSDAKFVSSFSKNTTLWSLKSGNDPSYLKAAYADDGTKASLLENDAGVKISMPQNRENVQAALIFSDGYYILYNPYLNSTSGSSAVEINELVNSHLINTDTFQERLGITADAKMDTSSDIKDLVAYIEGGEFYYETAKKTGAIQTGDCIPFFGNYYNVSKINTSQSPYSITLETSAQCSALPRILGADIAPQGTVDDQMRGTIAEPLQKPQMEAAPVPKPWNPKVTTSGTGAKISAIRILNPKFEINDNVKIKATAASKVYKAYPSATSPDATWLSGGPSSISYGTITEMPYTDNGGNIWYNAQFKQKLSTRGEAILANAWVTQNMLVKLNADGTTTDLPDSYTSHFKLEARGTGYSAGQFLMAKAGGALTQDIYLYVMSTDADRGVSAFAAYASESEVLSSTAAPKTINLQAVSRPPIFEKKQTALFEDLACYDFDEDGTLTSDECVEDIETYLQKNIRGCWTQIMDVDHADTPAQRSEYGISITGWYAGQDCSTVDVAIPFQRAKKIEVVTTAPDETPLKFPYKEVTEYDVEELTAPLPPLPYDGEGEFTIVVDNVWQDKSIYPGYLTPEGSEITRKVLEEKMAYGGSNYTGRVEITSGAENGNYKSNDQWLAAIGMQITDSLSENQIGTLTNCDAAENVGISCDFPAYKNKLDDLLNAQAQIGFNGDIATYDDMMNIYIRRLVLESHIDNVLAFAGSVSGKGAQLAGEETFGNEMIGKADFAGGNQELPVVSSVWETAIDGAKLNPEDTAKLNNLKFQYDGAVARTEHLNSRVLGLTETSRALTVEYTNLIKDIATKEAEIAPLELAQRQGVLVGQHNIDRLQSLREELTNLRYNLGVKGNQLGIANSALGEFSEKLRMSKAKIVNLRTQWFAERTAALARATKGAGVLNSVKKGLVKIGRGLGRLAGVGVAVIVVNDARNVGAAEASWKLVNGLIPMTVALDDVGPDSPKVKIQLAEKRQQLHDNVVPYLDKLGKAYWRGMKAGGDKEEYNRLLLEDQQAINSGDPNAAQNQRLINEANGIISAAEATQGQ
ncbi:MAG TPA: thioredoxin domain-containing protein [archaeon]|nr:thioredoxin domain-containing protein [archaeon]